MNNSHITPMTEGDLREVEDIFFTAFNGLGEQWTRESVKKHVKETFFGECHFVVRENSKMVGFIMAIPLTRENGTELFVDSIAILPDKQKNGIGQMLWDTLKTYGSENNFVGIRLLANRQLQSFHWYSEMGYSETGWVEMFKEL